MDRLLADKLFYKPIKYIKALVIAKAFFMDKNNQFDS